MRASMRAQSDIAVPRKASVSTWEKSHNANRIKTVLILSRTRRLNLRIIRSGSSGAMIIAGSGNSPTTLMTNEAPTEIRSVNTSPAMDALFAGGFNDARSALLFAFEGVNSPRAHRELRICWVDFNCSLRSPASIPFHSNHTYDHSTLNNQPISS